MSEVATLAILIGVILLAGGFLTATFSSVSSTEIRVGLGLVLVGAILLVGGFFVGSVLA